MAADRVVVREIAWRDVFPWLIIFRTFGLAKSMPVLFLATLGALATPVGWRVAESLFLDEQAESENLEFSQIVFQNRSWPGIAGGIPIPNNGRLPSSVQEVLNTAPDCVQPVFLRFIQPLVELTDPNLPVTHAAYFAFGLLWTLFVWGLFGGAISRIAAVRLGREERISLGEALRHAIRKLGAHVASPLFPLLGVGLVMLPILGVGFLMRWDWGVLVAGLLWIIVLLGGLFITILLLGLLFGWPLMWATIASEENGDAFEAFSRSYSYTFQRPLHYLFYALVATLFGGFSWLLVYHFSEGVIAFAQWPAAMGAGTERWYELAMISDPSFSGDGLNTWGTGLIRLASSLVRSIATGFAYSLFWCLATAIYLLLRQDVDQTEFDEVYVDNEDLQYVLPPMDADGAHAKGVVDGKADSPPAEAAATEPPETSSSDSEGAAERT